LAPPAIDPARQALLDETRRLVAEVASRLEGLGVAEATRKALADSREQLALPFLLVVVGEFNAGKSAFINALLGSRILEQPWLMVSLATYAVTAVVAIVIVMVLLGGGLFTSGTGGGT